VEYSVEIKTASFQILEFMLFASHSTLHYTGTLV